MIELQARYSPRPVRNHRCQTLKLASMYGPIDEIYTRGTDQLGLKLSMVRCSQPECEGPVLSVNGEDEEEMVVSVLGFLGESDTVKHVDVLERVILSSVWQISAKEKQSSNRLTTRIMVKATTDSSITSKNVRTWMRTANSLHIIEDVKD